MLCSNCGKENLDDSRYCMTCGSEIRKVKPFTSNELAKPRDEIGKAIGQRAASDTIIPPWIVVIPFIVAMIGGMVIFAVILSRVFEYFSENGELTNDYDFIAGSEWMILLALAISTVFYIIYGMITYKLIDRMNKHSAREVTLRLAVSSFIENLVGSSTHGGRGDLGWSGLGGQNLLSPDDVKRRSPVLWMLIIALPIFGSILQAFVYFAYGYGAYSEYSSYTFLIALVPGLLMLYMFNFLMEETREHDRRWIEFTRDVKVSLAMAGLAVGTLPDHAVLERRSFWLYFVLSIITLGIFVIFWWYVLLKDPNEHFKKQWEFEDELLRFISPR